MIEFNEEDVNARTTAVIDECMSKAIRGTIDDYFGVRIRHGQVEVGDPYAKRNAVRIYVVQLLERHRLEELHRRLLETVMKWIQRSPKTKRLLYEAEVSVLGCLMKRYEDDFDLQDKAREWASSLGVLHATEDFTAILNGVCDRLKKELNTDGPTE